MSDDGDVQTDQTDNSDQQQHDSGKSGWTPPASQEDFNRILNDRVKRERAKYADYESLKGAAAELQTLKDRDKTEAEKAAEKVAIAEATVATMPQMVADRLRKHLVALHEIPADDAELFLTATDPELLMKQVDRLVAREKDRRKQGNHVSREGTNTQATAGSEHEFVRQLFGG